MFGFLLQWSTILTMRMLQVLVHIYMCLARRRETDVMQGLW